MYSEAQKKTDHGWAKESIRKPLSQGGNNQRHMGKKIWVDENAVAILVAIAFIMGLLIGIITG